MIAFLAGDRFAHLGMSVPQVVVCRNPSLPYLPCKDEEHHEFTLDGSEAD